MLCLNGAMCDISTKRHTIYNHQALESILINLRYKMVKVKEQKSVNNNSTGKGVIVFPTHQPGGQMGTCHNKIILKRSTV